MLDHHDPVIRVLALDRLFEQGKVHRDLLGLTGDQHHLALHRQQLQQGIDAPRPGDHHAQRSGEDAFFQVPQILPA
ncbi:hypothetical protein GCM10011359_11810 [Nesterenkonia alkaliphila]|nr:hypothetical protein GCM10011359_11810 [Nesterenkonia alkaliphila]